MPTLAAIEVHIVVVVVWEPIAPGAAAGLIESTHKHTIAIKISRNLAPRN